jgi:hypothetical protein
MAEPWKAPKTLASNDWIKDRALDCCLVSDNKTWIRVFPEGLNIMRRIMIRVSKYHRLKSSWWLSYLIVLSILLYKGNALCSNLADYQKAPSGPIPIVNQAPIQLLFLQAIPDRAEIVPKGHGSLRLNTSITNTLLSQEAADYEGVIDMEMIRSSLDVRYGIAPGFEIGMSLPFVYSYSGIMDHIILDVEEVFDATRDIREIEEPNRYEYVVKKNKKAFISGKKKRCTGVGDLVLRIKGRIWDEGDRVPGLSARLAVKLPTGDTDRALGSGKPDYGLGLLLQKNIDRLALYGNADVIFPGDAFEQEGVPLSEFYDLMLGGEYRVKPRFSLLMQVNYMTRPFQNTGLQMLDGRIFDVLLGITYLTKRGLFIQGGAVEDFFDSENAGADITFFLNIGMHF